MNKRLSIPCSVLIPVRGDYNHLPEIFQELSALEFSSIVFVETHVVEGLETVISELIGRDCRVIQYNPDSPFKKRQWALNMKSLLDDWVLLLDSDEVPSKEFVKSVGLFFDGLHFKYSAVSVLKQFYFEGEQLRWGGFSFRALCLINRFACCFESFDRAIDSVDMEVHERILVDGQIWQFGRAAHLKHESLIDFHTYINKHNNYSDWEAMIRVMSVAELSRRSTVLRPKVFGDVQSRRRLLKLVIRALPFEGFLWFIYHYVVCLGFVEGRIGFYLSRIRANYIGDARMKVWEIRRKNKGIR